MSQNENAISENPQCEPQRDNSTLIGPEKNVGSLNPTSSQNVVQNLVKSAIANVVQDGSSNINGKFKSIEHLAKAYKELERKYGQQAQELGELRVIAEEHSAQKQNQERLQKQLVEFQNFIQAIPEKYHSDNYLKNREFRNILKSAYEGFGNKLNIDSMVDLLEKYVDARNSLALKVSAIGSEADDATDLLGYSTNKISKFNAPKKRLSDMTPEELDKALDELM